MPKRISWYECRYCERRYSTHDEAALCEDQCAKYTSCTMCESTYAPEDLTHRRDASGFRHRLCPECFEGLLSLGGKKDKT